MLLFLNLLFRVINNDNIDILSKRKHANSVTNCADLNGYKNELTTFGQYTHTCYCGEGYMSIKNSVFGNFQMAKPRFQNYAYLILSKNANIDVQGCTIYDITYHRKLISCEGYDYSTSISDTKITNCKSTDPESFIIENQRKTSSFINNKFDMKNNYARVFHLIFHTGCTMINNEIRNTIYENDDHGSGIYCTGKASGFPKFNFADCKFINCKGKNPAILKISDLNYDTWTIKNVAFESCEHLNYNGYFISIEASSTDPILTFDSCKFSSLTSNSNNGGGIGLWFKHADSDTHTLNFIHSQFLNIKHVSPNGGGGALQMTEAETNKKTRMIINNCTFANDNTDGKGGAIYYAVDQMITIFNCSFVNCASSNNGHAIYITKNNIETIYISYCNFTDCGTETNTFSVLLDVGYYEFLYNRITFSNQANSCGPLKATKLLNHVYRGNFFQNARNNEDYSMSCITEATRLQYTYTIVIENNTFDKIAGNCQGRCIDVELGQNSEVSIKNNTFQNCPSGGFLIKVIFSDLKNEFIIENCKFIGNTMGETWYNSLGSNSPVWVENKDYSQITIKFNNCYFENNYNYKKGGALFYGNCRYLINSKVCFNSCKFYRNSAKIGGGALAIITNYGCKIENCDFIENKAESDFGAIYIETENQNNADVEISIISSRFEGNGQNYEKSVVSFSNAAYTPVTISDCDFHNCNVQDNIISIQSNVKSILIEDSELKFDNSKGRGGISIQSTGRIEISHVQFLSTSKNSALRIVSSDTSNEILLNGCLFDSCSSAEHICYYLSLNTNSITIKNTIINKIESKNCNEYIGLIDLNNKQTTLNMNNVSYTNNIGRSLYGGGIGTNFINIYKIIFQNCYFSLNEAIQDRSNQRPNQQNQSPYYIGDGGAI